MNKRRFLTASLVAMGLLASSSVAYIGEAQVIASQAVELIARHGDGQNPDNAEARQNRNDGRMLDSAEAHQNRNDGRLADNAEAHQNRNDGRNPDNAEA